MTVTAEADDDTAGLSTLAALLGAGGNKSRWVQRLTTAHVAYTLARSGYKWVNGKLQETRFEVSVHDNDDIYQPVQAWVLERMPAAKKRALIARTARRRSHPVDEMGRPERRHLNLFFDGDRSQELQIDGHRVRVHIQKEDMPTSSGSDGVSLWRPAKIVFSTRTVQARDAVVEFLSRAADELEDSRSMPRLFTAARWGGWSKGPDMRPRPLDTVILRDGLLETLIDDLNAFYASERQYAELGLPWHRGFVFHGPPGTGKTSTARAIAGALGLDVFYVPLSDVQHDTDLGRMLGDVEPRSVLLLEDVDVVPAARERDDSTGGLTTTGLLNALDGVLTPHGLVTIMTTNRLEALDEAFLRPGRADRVEELTYLDQDSFDRLTKRLLGATVPGAQIDGQQVTAADVVEAVKRHLDDPQAALTELAARFSTAEVLIIPQEVAEPDGQGMDDMMAPFLEAAPGGQDEGDPV